jgi:hypothetical protein
MNTTKITREELEAAGYTITLSNGYWRVSLDNEFVSHGYSSEQDAIDYACELDAPLKELRDTVSRLEAENAALKAQVAEVEAPEQPLTMYTRGMDVYFKDRTVRIPEFHVWNYSETRDGYLVKAEDAIKTWYGIDLVDTLDRAIYWLNRARLSMVAEKARLVRERDEDRG